MTSRKPSISNSPPDLSPASPRFHSFSFELPQETHGGARFMPASFTPTKQKGKGPATAAMQIAEESEVEIAYFVTATWESQDGMENPVSYVIVFDSFHLTFHSCLVLFPRLEAPILFQPEVDFGSLNALQQNPDSWLEMPLRFDRPLPFTCAVSPYLFFLSLLTDTSPPSHPLHTITIFSFWPSFRESDYVNGCERQIFYFILFLTSSLLNSLSSLTIL
jgi:hypothetical protein